LVRLDSIPAGSSKKRLIDQAYAILEKQKKKKEPIRPITNEELKDPAFDEDFSILFDWAQHLDEKSLADYEVQSHI
jgi:hypothetical protein